MPCEGLKHVLGILKSIREQAGKQLGDTIRVQLLRNESDRSEEVPSDLADLWKNRAARLTKSIDMMRRCIRT